jgi:glycosyltransferase involved in cell wall biosynthesis
MNKKTDGVVGIAIAATGKRPRYSFVVPIFRDASLARDFCQQFQLAFSDFLKTDELAELTEVLFVCDGGAADDFSTIELLRADFPFVRCFDLSRNFGQHVAICCGYSRSRGELVGMLNVDQQDPPRELVTLIRYAEAHECDIVHGTSDSRHENFINRITSSLFNAMLNKLTGYDFPLNTCTVRILKRPVIDVFNGLAERQRYIPGLEAWMGFRHAYVPIRTQMRSVGRSSYNFRRRFSLALEAVISFSDVPLRAGVVFGAIVAFGGLVMGAALVIQKIWFVDLSPGYTSTVVLLVFFGGIQLLFAGLMSLYIGRILTEVQGRPLYIVRRSSDVLETQGEPLC